MSFRLAELLRLAETEAGYNIELILFLFIPGINYPRFYFKQSFEQGIKKVLVQISFKANYFLINYK